MTVQLVRQKAYITDPLPRAITCGDAREGKGRLDPPPGGPLPSPAAVWRLGEHDNLPERVVVLQGPVGVDDVVQAEDAVDVGPVDARLDLADDCLKDRPARPAPDVV